MPTKVLHLITELNVGGAEKVLARLLARLDRSQFESTVACLYGGDGQIADEIRALGIPVIDLKMASRWRVDAFWRLFRLLRRERPTVLHTWLFHANLPGRILGRWAGVPVIICSEHSMAMESRLRYFLNRLTIGYVDRVIAVSASVRDFCVSQIRLPPEKLVVIYNGVEIPDPTLLSPETARRTLNLPRDKFVIGIVSRLHPVKGIDVLLRALAHTVDAHLVVIGDGSEREALQTLTRSCNLTSRVYWAGYRSNVSELLPAFDLFVQPSLYEGLPMSILEAMATGLPVVATRVGGVPDLVVDGETGLLVPPGDAHALAGAISELSADPERRQHMGQAGLKRVRQAFALNHAVSQTEALYKEQIRARCN